MVERIDQMTTHPIVGSYYLVPAILWDWQRRGRAAKWWPVIGPKHDDLEFFNFHHKHYHVDPRFLTSLTRADLGTSIWGTKEQTVLGQPLNSRDLPDGPEVPQWRKMKCTKSYVDYPFGQSAPILDINTHFIGRQCDRSKFGWICPHRNVQLGSIMPIDGVITCPLHGMRIDTATGRTLGNSLTENPTGNK